MYIRHISSLRYNAVSLPYVFVLNQHKPIAQIWQEGVTPQALTNREDHPDIGPGVCDGLIQMYMTMKQHCMRGS